MKKRAHPPGPDRNPAHVRILLVEDDPDIRTVVKLSLESREGMTVEACPSGEDAMARGPAFGPDLVLLDVMMPEMDGPSTLERMRADPELGPVPVVFLTAKVLPGEVEEYMKIGAEAVIPKPFDPVRLPDTVRGILDRARARTES